jgi:hypothetical protein
MRIWIFCVKKIETTLHIYTKLASFSIEFLAEILWILAILRVKIINIKIDIQCVYTWNRHHFTQNFEQNKMGFGCFRSKIIKIKLEVLSVFTKSRHYFLRYFVLKYCEFLPFFVVNLKSKLKIYNVYTLHRVIFFQILCRNNVCFDWIAYHVFGTRNWKYIAYLLRNPYFYQLFPGEPGENHFFEKLLLEKRLPVEISAKK